jgi:hypothetical protein
VRQFGQVGVASFRVWAGITGFGIFSAAHPAAAQEVLLSGPLAGAPAVGRSSSSNPGAKLTDEFLLPSGELEAGGEVVFVTSDERGAQRGLDLTDVGLLRLRARRSIGEWVELFVGTELLVKQPEAWDEPIWQSVLGGLLVPFGHRLAMSLQGAGGELFQEQGLWWQVQSSLLAKPVIDRWARFELGFGHSILKFDIDRDPRPFWLEELVAHAETQLGEQEFAAWLGIDYSLPLASGPDASSRTETRFLDPNVGLGLHIGGVISPRKSSWDLFVVYSVVDRGDLERPSTTLPILDGGFDQRQLAIGVQHRFGTKRSSDDD